MVIISAILILLIASLFVNAKAMNDKTGKYDKISKWLDAGYKLLIVAYLYIMILKLAHPSIVISIILLVVSIISVVADMPIKAIRKEKYTKYRLLTSFISFLILGVCALSIMLKALM